MNIDIREKIEILTGIATQVYFNNTNKTLTELISILEKEISTDACLFDFGIHECTLSIMQIDAVVGSEYWGVD